MKKVVDMNILGKDTIPSPAEFGEIVRQTEASNQTVDAARSKIENILAGRDKSFLVIVGPCSIHDHDAALGYADRLGKLAKELGDSVFVVMRTYFEKPRSEAGWKGLMSDPLLNGSDDIVLGIKLCREIACAITDGGMPIAVEALDTLFMPFLSDLVSYAAIGARTVTSQTHRGMASGLSMPVGFKNATSGGEKSAVQAIRFARGRHKFPGINRNGQLAHIETRGNLSGHLILRGGDEGPNYGPEGIARASALLDAHGLQDVRLLVDCSHGNSQKDHKKQGAVLREVVRQRAAGNRRIVGAMLESHIKEGKQVVPDDLSTLEGGRSALDPFVSITDSCIGWEETAELLRYVAQQKLNSR